MLFDRPAKVVSGVQINSCKHVEHFLEVVT